MNQLTGDYFNKRGTTGIFEWEDEELSRVATTVGSL